MPRNEDPAVGQRRNPKRDALVHDNRSGLGFLASQQMRFLGLAGKKTEQRQRSPRRARRPPSTCGRARSQPGIGPRCDAGRGRSRRFAGADSDRGLRIGIALGAAPAECTPDDPGILIVDDDCKILTMTPNTGHCSKNSPTAAQGARTRSGPSRIRHAAPRRRNSRQLHATSATAWVLRPVAGNPRIPRPVTGSGSLAVLTSDVGNAQRTEMILM